MLTHRSSVSLLALVAGLAVSTAKADPDSLLMWANAAGGAASLAGNWSPALVPSAADDLTFAVAAGYAVTFSNLVPSSRTMAFRAGTVTLTMSSPHTVSTGITIGDTNALTGTMTLASGALNSTASVNLGMNAGSTGILNVADDSADFNITGATADMTVGVNGDAAMNITGGGRVQVADQFIVGSNASSSPTLTVSGAQAISPFQRSTLAVLGTSQSRLGQGGDATVSIANGALASFASDLVVSNGSASISTVTIGGGGGIGGILDAELTVAGDLLLGTNTSAAAPGGTATVTLNANGLLTVGGTLNLGTDPDGGTATLIINNDSVVEAGSFVDGAFGTLDHDDGTLRINGGTYTGHADPLVVTGTGGPTLNLTGGLTKTLAPAGAVGLIVGDDLGAGTWSGTLLIDGGADLIMSGTSKDIQIGDEAGTLGFIRVVGAGSRLVATDSGDDIRVGVNGIGSLQVDAGGQVLARNLQVPAASLNGRGTLELAATSAASITTLNLVLGNDAGPLCTASIGNGGVLSATDGGNGVVIRNTGIFTVQEGGLVDATGIVLIDGGELVVGGEVEVGTLVDVDGGGLLRSLAAAAGTPLVDGPVRVQLGAELEVLLNDLTVGDASDPIGFEAQDGSLITVGAHRLTILDANRAITDVTTINGGEIIAPNGLEIVTAGVNGTLDGTGTITTKELFYNSGGSVITATTAAGITINGKLRNNSGFIDGTKYTFNNNPAIPDSGWTGAGDIAAQVVFNTGTQINALANMTMGDNSTTGVTLNLGSELHADTRIVTLLDSNGIGLGSLTTLDTGNIVCAAQLVLNGGRELRGNGDLETPLFFVNGRVKVGPLPNLTSDIATLRVNGLNGTVTMSGTAIYDADLGLDFKGFHAGDQIIATGPLTVAGTLNVGLVPGFVPAAPDIITIARGASRTGTFATTNLPPVGSFGPAHVEYTATRVNVVMCYANCDGSVIAPTLNVNDFVCFQNRFAAASSLPAAQQLTDYANCDQSTIPPVLNVNDFTCFLNKFAAGCN